MGFDIYGMQPSGEQKPDVNWYDEPTVKAYFAWQKNTKGAYFRSNVWGWPGIWSYITTQCGDILTVKDAEGGCHNGGHIITKKKALAIHKKLSELDEQGLIDAFEKEEKDRVDAMPDIDCSICEGTGTRHEWVGWESEEEWLKHNDSLESNNRMASGFEWANKCKGCNGCEGTGKRRPTRASYFFSADLMREFIDFCKYSGGFQIC